MKMQHEKTKQKKFSKGKGMRLVGTILAAAVGAGVFGGVIPRLAATETVQAKSIGSKNQQACDACNGIAAPTYRDFYTTSDVNKNNSGSEYEEGSYTKPDGTTVNGYYSEELPYVHPKDGHDGKEITGVWTGGNARSSNNSSYIDNDPDDFMSVLPYGTIFVDSSNMYDREVKNDAYGYNWSNWYHGDPGYPFTKDTIVTINEDYTDDFMLFATYSDPIYQSSKADGSDVKPLNKVKNWTYQRSGGYTEEKIAYVGYLNDAEVNNGVTTVSAPEGSWLIKVTYPGRALLSNGTYADLVIKYTSLTVESQYKIKYKKGDYEPDINYERRIYKVNIGTDEEPEYKQIYGPLGIISGNELCVDQAFAEKNGNTRNNPTAFG